MSAHHDVIHSLLTKLGALHIQTAQQIMLLEQANEADPWATMDEAPKDRPILVAYAGSDAWIVTVASWDDGHPGGLDELPMPAGWYAAGVDEIGDAAVPAAYWMPFPDPPAAARPVPGEEGPR